MASPSSNGVSPLRRAAFAVVTGLLTAAACAALWGVYRHWRRPKAYSSTPYAAMFFRREAPLNYTLIPGWRGVDHQVPVAANAEGVRDDEWPPAPPTGLRILAVGDSQTFGVSVERERTWPRQLEERLRAGGAAATVRTAAVPGWSFSDEVGFLRQYWPRLQPHLVAVLVIPNDLDSSITAGPTHELMAPRQPFEPFYAMTDPWVMESFAVAHAKDPSLELTLANAFRESWRVPLFLNFYLENRSGSGWRLYGRYEEELGRLARFLRERGSDLLLLVDSRQRAGGFEKSVAQVYDRLGVRHVMLSRWAGDYEHYYRHWSNLPRDNHAGPAYHALIADVAAKEMAAMPLAGAFALRPPPGALPPPAGTGRVASLLTRLRGREPPTFDPLESEVTWRRPETLRQLICMGGQYSQTRFVLQSPASATAVSVSAPPVPAGSTVAVWIETGSFRGFAPAAAVDGRIIARLPSPIPAGSAVEIGLVVGAVAGGVFTELYPIQGIALQAPPAERADWTRAEPLLVRGKVEGLMGDGWMARELVLPLEGAALARRSSPVRLRLNLESLGPPAVHPIRLTAAANAGAMVAETTIAAPGPTEWTMDLDPRALAAAGGRIVIRSDRVFVPAALDPANPDRRELSVRVAALSLP